MTAKKQNVSQELKFARNIRNILDKLEISQREAALQCGLSESHLSQILRGDRSGLRIDTIEKLARGLGVSIEQLTQNPAHKGIDPAKDGPVHMTTKERKIWELYKALPRDHWKRKAIDEILITHAGKMDKAE